MAQVGGVEDVGTLQLGTMIKAMADANQTLTDAEAENFFLNTTGALTAQRNLTVPLNDARLYCVINACTGFGVQVLGATGTGIVVGATKTAVLRTDGVNFYRVTADL